MQPPCTTLCDYLRSRFLRGDFAKKERIKKARQSHQENNKRRGKEKCENYLKGTAEPDGAREICVCAGDSLTMCCMPPSGDWVKLLQDRHGANTIFLRAAESGDTTANMLSRAADVAACNPTSLVIMIGTNDIEGKVRGRSIAFHLAIELPYLTVTCQNLTPCLWPRLWLRLDERFVLPISKELEGPHRGTPSGDRSGDFRLVARKREQIRWGGPLGARSPGSSRATNRVDLAASVR